MVMKLMFHRRHILTSRVNISTALYIAPGNLLSQ